MQYSRYGEHVRIDDLVFDRRWSEYAVRALARGVSSSLAIPVSAQGDPIGSINLYSGRPQFFDDAQMQRAEQFAAQATDAVCHAAQLVGQGEPLVAGARSDVSRGASQQLL